MFFLDLLNFLRAKAIDLSFRSAEFFPGKTIDIFIRSAEFLAGKSY